MNELNYEGILLTEENIKKLALEGKIDKKFPYLDNISIMIPAIIANPSLIEIFPSNRYWALDNGVFNANVPIDIKNECLYYAIDEMLNVPYACKKLLEDEKTLTRIANKSLRAYGKILSEMSRNHPSMNIMKKIFEEKYEDKYVYNPDNIISFGVSSPRTLLNTLKKGGEYYVDRFSYEAYNDEVIDYIIENKIFDNPHGNMYKIPRITIAKLKEDINFFYKLSAWAINEDVIKYLKSIDFKVDYDRLSKNEILLPEFLIFLLEIDLNNVSYISDPRSINEEVIKFLKEHHYVYKKGDFKSLLEFDDIIESTVLNGNLDFIVMSDTNLSDKMCSFIIQYMKDNDYNIKTIKNKTLLNNEEFLLYLKTKYSNIKLLNLDDSKKYSNVARNINEEFIKSFSKEVADVIIDQIVLNDYYIDLENIFKNISIDKFHDLYQKLFHLEFKFNDKFNFYYFIKVCKFFESHLDLLKDINEKGLDEVTINNLLLAINNSSIENGIDIYNEEKAKNNGKERVKFNVDIDVDLNNLSDLRMYREGYKKKLLEATQIDLKDKIFRILINTDTIGAYLFLSNVLNLENAIYMQLEFEKDSKEYQYLESCIELVTTIDKVMKIDDENLLKKILYDVTVNYEMSAKTNIVSIKENIRSLYGMIYMKDAINPERLREKGKLEEIDGVNVYHLEGEDFHLFSHRLDFNQEDKYRVGTIDNLFKDFDRNHPKFANYVCTTYESKYSPSNLRDDEAVVYELSDISDLIAFGNHDVYISHTERPLFKVDDTFVNPIDMSFIQHSNGYTATEFDFLRKNTHNKIVGPSYLLCSDPKNISKKLCSAKRYNMGIIIFDYEKNNQMIKEEYLGYVENLDKLNYKEIYKMIATSTTYGFARLDSNLINGILERINSFSDKEKYLIMKTLEKYGYKVSVIEYKHNNHKK